MPKYLLEFESETIEQNGKMVEVLAILRANAMKPNLHNREEFINSCYREVKEDPSIAGIGVTDFIPESDR